MAHLTASFRRLSISRLILLFLSILAIGSLPLYSQQDSKGTSFWVIFLENAGSGGIDEVSDMRLYLSADYPVEASMIFYADQKIVPVSIETPHKSVEVDVGKVFGTKTELNAADVGVSAKALQIVVDDELSDANLSVNGVSVRMNSADAFLAFPEDVLGKEYVLLSYPNGYTVTTSGQYDQPSEFGVIATDDGTEIEVVPTAWVNGRETLDPFTISLKRGEVFFAQAALNKKEDISGTRIRANKPVAVFAGNRRTSVPTEVGNYRDHLVEQMIPVERWGKRGVIPPFFAITPGVLYPPVARVVAANDNTTWQINGTAQPPLMAGEVKEIRLSEKPMVITASDGIQVGAFEHSVGTQSSGVLDLGDPFMMLVPALEQYDTAYAFQSITHELFTRHFIDVVIPTAATASLKFDGAPTSPTFSPIPGTTLSYAIIEVGAGSHFIEADAPFGLMVYGYGAANSYGYLGGMRLPKRPAGVEREIQELSGIMLQAVPQPVRDGATALEITLSRPVRLSLELFTTKGEKVADLIQLRSFEPGTHRITPDLSGLENGVYLCRLRTEAGTTIVEKIILER